MTAFVHAAWTHLARALVRGRRLLARVRETFAEVREQRRKLEAELFRGRYHISSKNDDDLPIVS
jgi:DnaJ-domain-containing protein 1